MVASSPGLTSGGLWVDYVTAQGPRSRNEDWVGGYMPADPRWQAAKGGCFVVADGMGGHRGGAIASELAGKTTLSHYFQSALPDSAGALANALWTANQRVHEGATRSPDLSGMASTVVAAVVRGADAVVAHIGDCRAYLVRRNTAFSLTRDHTWVREMVDRRVLTPTEAATHPYRHVVTQYVGMGQEAKPSVCRLRLEAGDALLLCSDGISDRVPGRELGLLVDGTSAHNPASALVRRATALGSTDNASAIVVRYQPWMAGQRRSVCAGQPATMPEGLIPALAFGGVLVTGAAFLGLLLATLLP